MKKNVLDQLVVIFKQYAKKSRADENSQLCEMWSLKNPPNTLSMTKQIADIEDAFDVEIDEDMAVLLYDMTLSAASDYIQSLITDRK